MVTYSQLPQSPRLITFPHIICPASRPAGSQVLFFIFSIKVINDLAGDKISILFFKLYSTDYAIIAVLIFLPLPPSPSNPTPSGNPTHHCSSLWVTHISSLAAPLPGARFQNTSSPAPLGLVPLP